MLKQSFDRGSVREYVEAVRGVLGSDRLRDLAGHAAARMPGGGAPVDKLRSALSSVDESPNPRAGGAGTHPYLSRDPIISLVQSSIESELRAKGVTDDTPARRGLFDKIVVAVRELLHPGNFSPGDPGWVIKIAESTLERLADGNHPFNPGPAEYEISDSARLVLVGDWGTGLPRARSVATHMAEEIADALASQREVHVIHLGDVYYSGLPGEYKSHVLSCWPVSTDQAKVGATSWSLNGNHDMYSGGFGYFQTLLTDPRFAHQHSADGDPTSFFRLSSPSWDFIGLDTAWDSNVFSKGEIAVLNSPQADFVVSVAAERPSKKLALLSHHQYVSTYSPGDIGAELGEKLAPVLRDGRVTAWWWGHEHRCIGFEPSGGVNFPRCLGHGGVPEPQSNAATPPAGPRIAWEERDFFVSDDERWRRFGFAVLDLDGGRITARYKNDAGAPVHTEEIS